MVQPVYRVPLAKNILEKAEEHSIDLTKTDVKGNNGFMIACKHNSDKVVAILQEQIENLPMLDIHKMNKSDQNGFMLACENNSDKVLKIMFDKNSTFKFDFNATDINRRSGFILAAINKRNLKAVKVILANYQNHDINIEYVNQRNYSGVDYYHQNWPDLPRIKLPK